MARTAASDGIRRRGGALYGEFGRFFVGYLAYVDELV